MSAIGEFLREIMPSWLSPQPRDRWSSRRAAWRQARNIGEEDARALAREADEVWQHCVDDGMHGEAFPERAPDKGRRSVLGSDAREKPADSNDPH